MANPRLNEKQLARANALLDEIRLKLRRLARGSADLLFAYRRKVAKELQYDERGKPMHRRRVRERLWTMQEGRCAECGGRMRRKGAVLDRKEAKAGYRTEGNVELIHRRCDAKRQAARRYT